MTASSPARVAAIIPARMGSSRFPGKPLAVVRGLPMIEHVRRRAMMCRGFSDVIVATCDREIADAVKQCGGRVINTSPDHPGATDRVAEAARSIDCTHVVNVQGDEILILPEQLDLVIGAIGSGSASAGPVWNAVSRVAAQEEFQDRTIVKCAVSRSGRFLFCARDFPRHPGGSDLNGGYRIVLGIIAFEREFLNRYVTMPRTPLESAESIDQLRILEHDVAIHAVEFDRGYPGVNQPSDLAAVERILESDARQRKILAGILSA